MGLAISLQLNCYILNMILVFRHKTKYEISTLEGSDFPFISISGSKTFDNAILRREIWKTQRAALHNTLLGSMPIHNNLQLFGY